MKKLLYIALLIYVISTMLLLSCSSNKYENDEDLCNLLFEMAESDKLYRTSLEAGFGHGSQSDSLWRLQIAIDNKNTEQLIEIIKDRGFPNKKAIGCDLPIAPFLIFTHAQPQYFEEIETLIDNELIAKNVDSLTYNHMLWHINGRGEYILLDGMELITDPNDSTRKIIQF